MNARSIFLLISAISLPTTELAAQAGQEEGWLELLASRTRTAYRYTHPPAPGNCAAARLPDQARLVTPAHREAIGKSWSPGLNQSRWEALRGPVQPDTLDVRVVELWCGADGQSILLEADGYYLELSAAQLAAIDDRGVVTDGVLIGSNGSGQWTQLTLREDCAGGVCTFALTDVEPIAHDVQLAVAARDEAERMRREEADRRAESIATARVQTGASVGAQMDAVLDRRRLESLQRLGASDEQARAILANRVLVGMTPPMVRAAIGAPTDVRTENTSSRTSATWIYPDRTIVLVDERVAEIR